MFKSSLHFSSLVVLASLLGGFSAGAMIDEDNNTNGSSTTFQKSTSLSEERTVLHNHIKEKMEKIDLKDQEFVRSVFGKIEDSPHLLKFLNAFSVDQLEILGKYKVDLIPKAPENLCFLYSEHFTRYRLEDLQPLSAQKLKVIGKYKMLFTERANFNLYCQPYVDFLKDVSIKIVEIIGKYEILKPELSFYYYKPFFNTLKTFSFEKLKVIAENMESLFKDVEDDKRPVFIKTTLKDLSPEEIELFAQKNKKNDSYEKQVNEIVTYIQELKIRDLDKNTLLQAFATVVDCQDLALDNLKDVLLKYGITYNLKDLSEPLKKVEHVFGYLRSDLTYPLSFYKSQKGF